MSLISATLLKGLPIEKIVITVAGDTAANGMAISFNTSFFANKTDAITALEKMIEFLEGAPYPPVART